MVKAIRISIALIFVLCLCVTALVSCDKISGGEEHEHTFVEHDGQEPTCIRDGWRPYKTCSTCDEYSTYSNISALGHSYAAAYEPNGDVHTRSCTRCSSVLNEAHSWVDSGSVSPTCTTPGLQSYKCSLCTAEKSVSISILGHDYSENVEEGLACSRCSATISSHSHEWQTLQLVKEPTCTEAGEKEIVCTVCVSKKTETIAALGHDFSTEYVPNGDVHSLLCSRCTATSADHPHIWEQLTVTVTPTCTAVGEEKLGCSVCGVEKTEVLPTVPHVFDYEYKPNGDVHSIFCINCTATFADHPHFWEYKDTIKDPTCTEEGTELFVCSICNAEKTTSIPICHQEGEWHVVTPATALDPGSKVLRCKSCGTDMMTERIPADVESMPIIYLEGEYYNATNAKNEVKMSVSYVHPDGDSFESYATIKVQGSSSTAYDKKNYTIKLYKDEELDEKFKFDFGWGKESKYVMKANWVDFSQARNVVSCRLWGDIIKTRPETDIQKQLASLKTNGGAIDGFPIAVYMNGEFYGLYTMNVPKDEWMFGMGEKDENGEKSATEALIASDDWNHTDFYSLIGEFVEDSAGDLVAKDGGWELIYYGGDNHAWVAESFDALIKFCQDNDGDAFRAGISEYLDVDAAIDYVIYMYANCMHDNASKNMLWATYDGKVWIPSAYDQDGTFGQVWDGIRQSSPSSSLPFVNNGRIEVGINYGPTGNNSPKFILWDRIWNSFTEEILERYSELRQSVLSTKNMVAALREFEALIPESMFEADLAKWRTSRDTWWANKGKTGSYDYTPYHYDYMCDWVEDRMNSYDNAMQAISDYYYSN